MKTLPALIATACFALPLHAQSQEAGHAHEDHAEDHHDAQTTMPIMWPRSAICA